jgi:DNA-binding SARP family transcriptional activator
MILVHTLGTALIEVGRFAIKPTSPRKFAFLLYLAAERGRRIPRSYIQELLFPDQPNRNARHSLRELVYQLRQSGAALDAGPDSMELATGVCFDYEQLLELEALNADQIRSAGGGFMPGFGPSHSEAYAEWLDGYRARSISVLTRTLLKEADRRRDRGDWEMTEQAARACLALDPLNETATLTLAEMLYLAGAKAKANKLLDDYANEVGKVRSDLKMAATTLNRRMEHARESIGSRVTPRFVGRGEEMQVLRTALRQVSEGQVRCVAVSGEPGIGKSRLLKEFGSIVELEGVQCVLVAMQSHDAARPMGAFVDLVPALLRLPGALGCAPESMQALRRITGSPSAGLSDNRDKLELDTIAFAVTAAICDMCESIATEAPLALIIDDAHALDQFSINVLSALLSSRQRARILLLLGTREPRSILRSLRHADGLTSLPLRPLAKEATSLLIDDILSHIVQPPDSTRERLLEAAKGNPLFALTLASHYRDTRDVDDAPATLIELLGRRLDRLPHVALSVLATCVALGKHCTTDRLLCALEITPVVLLENIEILADLGLVDARSDVLAPAHPLVAEVMSTRWLPASKRVVNFRVAEIFETEARITGSPAYWWEAAVRWRDASESERALSAFRECASHAMEIGRASDAARILGEALVLPLCGESAIEAAKRLIVAADLSSDTSLVFRGHSVLRSCGIPEGHDEFELAARRAFIRDSQLPDRVFDVTLKCLQASTATAEHRVLAATLGLKGLFVADGASRVARMIEAHISTDDLGEVEEVVRLEFELLLRSANQDWDQVSGIADQLLMVAENKRPAARPTIQHNCGVAFSIAGKPYAAIDAWQRVFEQAVLVRCWSQQVRAASLIAGVYADLYDDESCDAWISRAVEADRRSAGLFDGFDLPVIQIFRSLAAADVAKAALLLAEGRQQGRFSGSPTRERWGAAFDLLVKSKQGASSEADQRIASEFASRRDGTLSGVRDVEVAAAANILAVHDRDAATKLISTYLRKERRGRQLIDRQLSDTIRELKLSEISPIPRTAGAIGT